jgi:hypothetical protein
MRTHAGPANEALTEVLALLAYQDLQACPLAPKFLGPSRLETVAQAVNSGLLAVSSGMPPRPVSVAAKSSATMLLVLPSPCCLPAVRFDQVATAAGGASWCDEHHRRCPPRLA